MGRGRHTAKTGDKGIYKRREAELEASRQSRKGDDFAHEDSDFLKLEVAPQASESDDEVDQQEAIMDLGGGSGSSDDDDDDSSGNEEDARLDADDDDDEEQADLSSDDDQDEALPMKNVRDWGRQKKDYYDGDTADLEIGQEEEDALVEEEAAKEIQAARLDQMKEEDFALSDDDDEEGEGDNAQLTSMSSSQARNWEKLSRPQKAKILDRQHPEVLPLVNHFTGMLREWEDQTSVVTKALMEGEDAAPEAVGATQLGQQFLVTKALLQASAALNLANYLLLKSEHAENAEDEVDPEWIQSHPVMKHLHNLNALVHKLEDQVEAKVPGLDDQLDKLTKVCALLKNGEVDLDDDEEAANGDSEEDDNYVDQPGEEGPADDAKRATTATTSSVSDGGEEGDDDEESVDEGAMARNIANEARFGLRASEVATSKPRQRRLAPSSDFGDAEEGDGASKSLAATINSIEQRSSTGKRKNVAMADAIDDTGDEDERVRRGLAMMEADIGPASDGEGAGEEGATIFDPEKEGDEDDGFYAQVSKKSKSKRDFKKSLYAVAPKYPRLEVEVDGERALSKHILKNRGLVPHKAKINRNPRVKKREQYRKALIRRKGAVREVRTDEGHKYGGETTGIKSGISRSRRLKG